MCLSPITLICYNITYWKTPITILCVHYIFYIYRLAESKKEVANQYYSQKQYKKALIGYNEVIGKYSKILYIVYFKQ